MSVAAGAGRCESWLHRPNDPARPAPGARFCAVHERERALAERVEGELAMLAATLDAYAAEPERHPDEAKDFIEPAIRGFFNEELRSLGLACGPGYRSLVGRTTPEQMDIALVLSGALGGWNAHVSARRHVEHEWLGAHMEIAYRADGSGGLYDKVREDLDHLHRSVDQGVASGKGLPWTASVLLGSAWPSRAATIMGVVHHRYHDTPPKRVPINGKLWWPYVDAFVMPTVMYEKHDVFLTEQISDERLPAYFEVPTDRTSPLRPLAIARAFLMHRVRILMELEEEDTQAWPTSQSSALFGVPPADIKTLHAHFPCDVDPVITHVWHAASRPEDHGEIEMAAMRVQTSPSCVRAHPLHAKIAVRHD